MNKINTKETYTHKGQEEVLKSTSNIHLTLCGRGWGKTHLIGCQKYRSAATMPRGKSLLMASTYGVVLRNVWPGIEKVWNSYGMVENVHYVVGKKPPANWDKPLRPPKSYKNTVYVYNGYHIEMWSLAQADLIRGSEFDELDWDEAALGKQSQLNDIIIPCLRGNWQVFKSNPRLHQKRLYTSVPRLVAGQWVLEIEDKAKEKPQKWGFTEGTSFDNIAALGEKTLRDWEDTMDPLSFQIEILNKRVYKLPDGWYHAFDDSKHTYIDDDYTYDKRRRNFVKTGEAYYNPAQPLYVSFDFGGRINCALVFQKHKQSGREVIRVLREVLITENTSVKAVVNEVCDLFPNHQNHKMIVTGDPAGHNKRPEDAPIYNNIKAYFRARGWGAVIKAAKSYTSHLQRHNFTTEMLGENNKRYPLLRINSEYCKWLILAMNTTGIKDNMEKDKSGERKQENDQRKEPHITDCLCYFLMVEYRQFMGGRRGSRGGGWAMIK